MNEIRKAVNKVDPTICIYGEGWAAEAPQYPADSLAMKGNISQMPELLYSRMNCAMDFVDLYGRRTKELSLPECRGEKRA